MRERKGNIKNNQINEINKLIENTVRDRGHYNQLVRKIWEVELHLISEQNSSVKKKLHEKLQHLNADINSGKNKKLFDKIQDDTIKIEKLERNLLGESFPGSPSFLIKKK